MRQRLYVDGINCNNFHVMSCSCNGVAPKKFEHYVDPIHIRNNAKKFSLEIGVLHNCSKLHCRIDALITTSTPRYACVKTTRFKQQPTTTLQLTNNNTT